MNYTWQLPEYWYICIYFYRYAIVFESQEKMFRTSVNARTHCLLSREPDRISAQTLYCQKLESLPKICTADSMWLSLLVFTQLFLEVARSQPGKPVRKQNLTRNSHSRWFKVMHFGITEKPTTAYSDIITLVSSLKYLKNSNRKRWKLPFSTTPLSFDAPYPGNLHEYSQNLAPPETRVIVLHFAADSMGLSSFNFFVAGFKIYIFSATEWVSAVQGHPRSLILAPIERAYATSY